MAQTPPNQSGTQTGRITPAKPKKPTKPTTKPPATDPVKGKGKYQWGTGGRVHSIPLAQHQQNVDAKQALGTLDLTAPPTAVQALQEATSAANLQYGPQVNAAQQLQSSVTPWFNDFLAKVAGYARAASSLSAPVIGQAQGYQQGAAAQTAPGLDPNSEAGQQAAQAAAGRGALSQLGLDALNANANATQDYFGGQQAMAARQLPQAQAAANAQLANAQSQRGAAVQGFLTTARQNAQNYAIARGTLLNNQANIATDAATAAANTTETNRHNTASEDAADKRITASQDAAADRNTAAGATPNKYGIPKAQWDHWSTSHRQRVIDAFNKKNGNDKPKTDPKDIAKATGNVQNTITDIIGAWKSYTTSEVDDATKPVKDAKGRAPGTADWTPTYAKRAPKADEIRSWLAGDNKAYTPQMIHIALLRNARPPKPLDQASIDYLHRLDQNIRIPKDWLPAGPATGGTGNPASSRGTGLG